MLGKYQVNAIVAMAENRVIGVDGKLPWHLPEDMKRFSKLTTGHAVLMGRKTFESLPDKYRPLPKRLNLVLSRTASRQDLGVDVFESLEVLKAQLLSGELTLPSSEIWVIGGAEIYEALKGVLDRIYLTRLNLAFKGDAFLSNIEADMRLIAAESFPDGVFEVYAI